MLKKIMIKKTFDARSRDKRSTSSKFNNDKPWKKSAPSRDDGRTELHTATCVKCGKECMVPFKPNGKKPVFCSICYKREGVADAPAYERSSAASTVRRFDGEIRPEKESSLNEQLRTLNSKLDMILKVLGSRSRDDERPARAAYKKR